jgi:hypothetical protein
MTILLAILILLNLAMLVAGWRLYRRTARLANDSRTAAEGEQRARWVREMEARERWAALDLNRLHPVNRDEVAALLGRIEGASSRVLTRRERDFLDRMVEAERRQDRRASRGSGGTSRRPAHP